MLKPNALRWKRVLFAECIPCYVTWEMAGFALNLLNVRRALELIYQMMHSQISDEILIPNQGMISVCAVLGIYIDHDRSWT